MAWLFLLAYACSGLAGLIYEVSWTRLLTLYIGHTTAAASAVVAAFLGGLAVGASLGGRVASRLTPRQSLVGYVLLEGFVAVAAFVLPFELNAFKPLLKWAYQNGDPGLLFPAIRLSSCLVMVFVPSLALGATFPMAIRWFASASTSPARAGGVLYAINTTGAAVGALLAGFVLIPAVGVSGATRIGIAASVAAAVLAAIVWHFDQQVGAAAAAEVPVPVPKKNSDRGRRVRGRTPSAVAPPVAPAPPWLAVIVVGVSGFAALLHEIVWTRVLVLLLGPTVYAFAATLAVVIAGIAIGSYGGSWLAGRTRQPAAWLAIALAAGAISVGWTSALAGGDVPRTVAVQMATSSTDFESLLSRGLMLATALILPTAVCLGAAFPLALGASASGSASTASRFALVYAINTIGAVAGSLAAGFLLIPRFGLQGTLAVSSACLVAAALAIVAVGRLARTAQVAGALASIAAAAVLVLSPPWDRALLASGPYLYAPYVPKDLDLETQLKAGELLYYREGASSTVSVKKLTGTTTLAVDGKVDASNRSDMLTQKLVAHLPLLLHENPREVAIIGLGSGVSLGAALSHPIARAEVVEISPEVVEASRFFAEENGHALDDPRTRLIVGDGRSHLLLSDRQYDVIVSEPSNPWIAGVASLFTREFFEAARARLAPGGIICQWAHTYNISDADLRSIVATFTSVFPNGTLWLIGEDDVLLAASEDPLDARLENIARSWTRANAAKDLAAVGALEPFAVYSLYAGGPKELAPYVSGASLLSDDRMALEFSGPRELHSARAGENGAVLAGLLAAGAAPAPIEEALAAAGASQWRRRAAMMARSDVYDIAYDDYVRALTLEPDDRETLDGFVRTAVLSGRAADALSWVRGVNVNREATPSSLVAISKLLAARGLMQDAIESASEAAHIAPTQPEPLEQLASIHADTGDNVQFDVVVAELKRVAPERPATLYYSAASAFTHGRADEAARLAERAIAADPAFAPVYDLAGAVYTKLGQIDKARNAFLTSLRFDAHDSTAYTNLGLLELAAGNTPAAANLFSEALSLAPNSPSAREGLAQALR